jgi:hypothetical protein
MKTIQRIIAITFSIALLLICVPADVSISRPAIHEHVSEKYLNESVFPDSYPEFLKQVYILLRQAEELKQLSSHDQEDIVKSLQKELKDFFHGMLEDEKLNVKRLYSFARAQAGQDAFERFLKRFGIDRENQVDIELEVLVLELTVKTRWILNSRS